MRVRPSRSNTINLLSSSSSRDAVPGRYIDDDMLNIKSRGETGENLSQRRSGMIPTIFIPAFPDFPLRSLIERFRGK